MKDITREYKTIIPLNIPISKLSTWGEEYVKLAKRLNAGIFLVTKNVFGDRERFLAIIEETKQQVEFFKDRGVDVGVWLCPTTGHEGMGLAIGKEGESFTHRQVADYSSGKAELIEQAFCPLDENFTKDFAWKMQVLSQTGATMSLFEDDFRLSGPPISKVACCCDLHMKAFSKMVGRTVTVDELRDLIYNNDDLSYRQKWQDLKRDTMLNFVKALRDAVDKVNPSFRIGISASRLNYDIDGATIQEISIVAAGNTKPFVRLTGAPYWAKENNTISSVIESNRMQFGWFSGSGIEILSEGDPYPRPRIRLPAAYLEVFDQILRANGDCDGIYKYVTAYRQGPWYEEGYIDFHVKNQELYALIDKLFDGKKMIGLQPFVKQQKLAQAVFDDLQPFEEFGAYYRLDSVIPPESYLVTDCSIPTSYDGCDYAGLAFGENARHLSDAQLKNGIITDLKGAKILKDKGIDVGLLDYQLVDVNPTEEIFLEDNTSLLIGQPSPYRLRFYKTRLSDTAKVVGVFHYGQDVCTFGPYKTKILNKGDMQDLPSCYLYENADGQRFCVYTFIATNVQNRDVYNAFNGEFFASYARQRQLINCIEWVQNKKLPAKTFKTPYLYTLCAEDSDSVVIGLWNICNDEVLSPKIELGIPAKDINFYLTDGYLDGDTVYLTKTIKPYDCVFIEIKK